MTLERNQSGSAEVSAKIISEGGIVILPCDTIYGFSGIHPGSETKIRAIKGRGEDKPFIRLIRMEDIVSLAANPVDDDLLALWPGPLTLITHAKNGGTLGIRVPADPFVQKIMNLIKSPLISTSVNRSGKPAVEKINKIIEEFEADVNLIIVDGDREGASPSTILDKPSSAQDCPGLEHYH